MDAQIRELAPGHAAGRLDGAAYLLAERLPEPADEAQSDEWLSLRR